jgi:hypothetical protein
MKALFRSVNVLLLDHLAGRVLPGEIREAVFEAAAERAFLQLQPTLNAELQNVIAKHAETPPWLVVKDPRKQ